MLALFAKVEIIPYSRVIVSVYRYRYSAIAQSGLRQFKLAELNLSLLLVVLSLLLLLSFMLSFFVFSLLISLLLLLLYFTDHKNQLIALLIGDKLFSVI